MIYCAGVMLIDQAEGYPANGVGTNASDEVRREIEASFTLQATTTILVCTAVTDQFVQLNYIALVINFELPVNEDVYAQRIGYAGRLGRKCLCINLITQVVSMII